MPVRACSPSLSVVALKLGLGTEIGLGTGGAQVDTHSWTAGSAPQDLIPALVGV